jgi:hypothetical protein
MTPKVGEARDTRVPLTSEYSNKSATFLSFAAVLGRGCQGLVAGPTAGPVVPKFVMVVEHSERWPEETTGFARSGKAADAELGAPAVVDPLELSLARPLGATPREPPRLQTPATDAVAVASLEWAVERLSFGGDRRTGIARLELGGVWAGTVLVVRASGREVQLELAGHPHAAALAERLVARLRARGLAADVSLS